MTGGVYLRGRESYAWIEGNSHWWLNTSTDFKEIERPCWTNNSDMERTCTLLLPQEFME